MARGAGRLGTGARLEAGRPRADTNSPHPGPDPAPRSQRLNFKLNMYRLREEREIEPKTLISLISSMLYEKR